MVPHLPPSAFALYIWGILCGLLTFCPDQDITTDNKDEIISDAYKLIEAGDGLWEVDCRMITKGAENFGQSPSRRHKTCC